MAAAIRQKLGTEPQLIEGRGGIFDVKVDGSKLYSKHETGRFPEDDEILSAIDRLKQRAGG